LSPILVLNKDEKQMHYRITVRGHLDDHWSVWFEGLMITNGADGEATLAGHVLDQAALHGLLVKIRDLGLPLIAVVPGSAPENDGAGSSDRLDASRDGDGNS
jgi:hypothetical protein